MARLSALAQTALCRAQTDTQKCETRSTCILRLDSSALSSWKKNISKIRRETRDKRREKYIKHTPLIVTAASEPRAEAACRLCRGGAVKTEGQLSIFNCQFEL